MCRPLDIHVLTTEGSTLSESRFGPSRWEVGEPSLESVLLSDEFMLVSLTLEFTTLAVITCIDIDIYIYICTGEKL